MKYLIRWVSGFLNNIMNTVSAFFFTTRVNSDNEHCCVKYYSMLFSHRLLQSSTNKKD